MIMTQIFLPMTYVGDIIKLVIFGILVITLFVLTPTVVGKTYKEGAYQSIMSKLHKILRK